MTLFPRPHRFYRLPAGFTRPEPVVAYIESATDQAVTWTEYLGRVDGRAKWGATGTTPRTVFETVAVRIRVFEIVRPGWATPFLEVAARPARRPSGVTSVVCDADEIATFGYFLAHPELARAKAGAGLARKV